MKHKLSKKLSEKPFGLLPVLFRRAQTANSKLNVLLYELWQAWFCFPFLIQLLIVYVLKPLCRWQRAQARISVISLYFRRSLYMHAVEPRYLELPALSDLNQFPLDLLLLFQSFILGYLELGYLELPAISNLNPFPLDLPLRFQPFILVYLELPAISNLNPSAISLGFSLAFSVIPTRLSRTQLSRTIFCFPWPKSTPVITNSNDEVDQWTNRSESVRTQLESILKRHYTFNIRRTSINIKIIRNCALVFAV